MFEFRSRDRPTIWPIWGAICWDSRFVGIWAGPCNIFG